MKASISNYNDYRYFGLEFDDVNNNKCWLEMDKKVADQRIKNLKKDTLQFKFRVRFYPETAEDEIIQNSTLHLFYLQVIKILF